MENQRSVSLPKNIKPLYSNVHSWPYQSESRVQIILVFKAQVSVFVQDFFLFCLVFFLFVCGFVLFWFWVVFVWLVWFFYFCGV